jgi:hypothetical protein
MTDLRTWDAWRENHQPFELGWWREHAQNYQDPTFTQMWQVFSDFIEPRGRIIDIGCGPRPPFAPCVVIEPLADAYLDLPGVDHTWWWGVEVHAQPAEQRVPGLLGDTIVCWNAIDHAIGWRDILDNMVAYAAPHAHLALSTDFWPPFDGHPGFDRDEFLAEVDKRFITIRRRDKREDDLIWREVALILHVKET